MIILLDGYNVINIGNIAPARELHERRKELIRLAVAYRLRKKGTQVLIFFDSKEQIFLSEPANSFVQVLFTKPSATTASLTRSADDAIIDWIERCRKPAEIQVATDDNELRERSKTSGATYISVAELIKRFDSNGPRKSAAISAKQSSQTAQGRGSRKESDDGKAALTPKAVKEVNHTLPTSWFK
jgi:predicted RNA-binding protein with PIN domain